MSELAQVIVAVGGLITAIAGATVTVLVALRQTNKKVDAVMGQVTTLNESTIGQLAAAIETARIEAKESAGRMLTDKEQRHIDADPATNGGAL